MPKEATQPSLPGTVSDEVPEVEQAAMDYAQARDARIAPGVIERQEYLMLARVMAEHDLEAYHRPGIKITRPPKDEPKFKVECGPEPTPEEPE